MKNKYLLLKIFILLFSILGAIVVASGLIPKLAEGFHYSLILEGLIILSLLICSLSGFFAKRYPLILWFPIILLAVLAFIELSFIASGLTGAYAGKVPYWHSSLLFIILVVAPLSLSWTCYKWLQSLSKR